MRAPTVDRLVDMLDLDRNTARTIRGLMKGDIDPCDVSESCDAWVRRCYHEPDWTSQALHAINDLLECHGVEGWTDPKDFRFGVSFCNTGDTYALTVCLIDDNQGERWRLCSWGGLAGAGVCTF